MGISYNKIFSFFLSIFLYLLASQSVAKVTYIKPGSIKKVAYVQTEGTYASAKLFFGHSMLRISQKADWSDDDITIDFSFINRQPSFIEYFGFYLLRLIGWPKYFGLFVVYDFYPYWEIKRYYSRKKQLEIYNHELDLTENQKVELAHIVNNVKIPKDETYHFISRNCVSLLVDYILNKILHEEDALSGMSRIIPSYVTSALNDLDMIKETLIDKTTPQMVDELVVTLEMVAGERIFGTEVYTIKDILLSKKYAEKDELYNKLDRFLSYFADSIGHEKLKIIKSYIYNILITDHPFLKEKYIEKFQ